MLLKGPNVQLIPYTSNYWMYLAQWFYDTDYKEMWRHHPIAWGQAQFEKYPQIINGQVFLIIKSGSIAPIGFVQMIPDCKTNRAFFVGIVIDKAERQLVITDEVFCILFNYGFNRLGYRKAIIEILASRDVLKQRLLREGFFNEGRLLGEAFMDGEFVDEVRLSMSSEFFNKKHKKMVELWDHL